MRETNTLNMLTRVILTLVYCSTPFTKALVNTLKIYKTNLIICYVNRIREYGVPQGVLLQKKNKL